MKRYILNSVFITTILMIGQLGFSQPAITGPDCVVPGTLYQYIIKGNWDSTFHVQICIIGGVIIDQPSSANCTSLSTVPKKVQIIWKDSAFGNGAINLVPPSGQIISFSVHFTKPLFPGSIDNSNSTQVLRATTLPKILTGSPAKGGSCSPNFSYQWQQSGDLINWTDIKGENKIALTFSSKLTQTTFFRRKVTELTSGTIGYSNSASIYVMLGDFDSSNIKITSAKLGTINDMFIKRKNWLLEPFKNGNNLIKKNRRFQSIPWFNKFESGYEIDINENNS